MQKAFAKYRVLFWIVFALIPLFARQNFLWGVEFGRYYSIILYMASGCFLYSWIAQVDKPNTFHETLGKVVAFVAKWVVGLTLLVLASNIFAPITSFIFP